MMAWKKLLVVVVLLSAILGVDAISEKRTKKLYRKAGRWQQKLRGVWALLGVKPFLVQPGEEGDECVLKSKVEEDYVLKTADVFTQGDVDAAVAAATKDLFTQDQLDAAVADATANMILPGECTPADATTDDGRSWEEAVCTGVRIGEGCALCPFSGLYCPQMAMG